MGPFAGFVGAVNFYKEIDRLVNSNAFRLTKAPWADEPELSASYARITSYNVCYTKLLRNGSNYYCTSKS